MADLSQNWSLFVEQVRSPAFVEFVSHRLGGSIGGVRLQTEHYVEEANHTIQLLKSKDLSGLRVMEVGCGPGFVSTFLERLGFDVVSIEPEDTWFVAVTEYFGLDAERRLKIGIEGLLPDYARSFDFIFSNNVLEHVRDFEQCVSILGACLRPEGTMIHNLPNYFVPFEPHFGIPLVPFFPQLTRFLIPKSMWDSGLWRSLNFATVWQVEKAARKLGATVALRHSLMSASFQRLLIASPYTERHPILARVAKFASTTGLLDIVRRVPPRFATPMVFEWRV